MQYVYYIILYYIPTTYIYLLHIPLLCIHTTYSYCLQYYTKVSEVMSWMADKRSLVALKEYGKDEDSTQALIKKHEAIELEIEAYRASIDRLSEESKRLLEGGHFDSEVVKKREVSVL